MTLVKCIGFIHLVIVEGVKTVLFEDSGLDWGCCLALDVGSIILIDSEPSIWCVVSILRFWFMFYVFSLLFLLQTHLDSFQIRLWV